MDYVRDSQLGHLIRAVTNDIVLQWPEELPGYELKLDGGSASEKSHGRESFHTNDTVRGQVHSIESRNEISKYEERQDESPIDMVASRVGVSSAEAEANLAKMGTNAADIILVDWYSKEDVDNPQNWTMKKKLFTTLVIW
jgi:MFS transporter, DHA1 family, multidrug resistance protein